MYLKFASLILNQTRYLVPVDTWIQFLSPMIKIKESISSYPHPIGFKEKGLWSRFEPQHQLFLISLRPQRNCNHQGLWCNWYLNLNHHLYLATRNLIKNYRVFFFKWNFKKIPKIYLCFKTVSLCMCSLYQTVSFISCNLDILLFCS